MCWIKKFLYHVYHVRVIIDNISFYFYAIISVKNLMKQSCNGTSQLFHHGLKIFWFWGWICSSNCKMHAFQHGPFQPGLCKFQNGTTQWFMTHSESQEYVSISFYFDFYFENCMQNYPAMSREHSGKKLLVTTEDILHKSHFKFWISEPHSLQISKSLIFSHDEVVVDSNSSSDR